MKTGLNTDFVIQNGKFVLSSEAPKAFNELWFLINFDLQRTYLEDFSPGFQVLQQKSTSYLIQNQTLIMGNLTKLITAYISNIKVLGIDLLYGLFDRKQFSLAVTHQYIPDQTVSVAITFIGG